MADVAVTPKQDPPPAPFRGTFWDEEDGNSLSSPHLGRHRALGVPRCLEGDELRTDSTERLPAALGDSTPIHGDGGSETVGHVGDDNFGEGFAAGEDGEGFHAPFMIRQR